MLGGKFNHCNECRELVTDGTQCSTCHGYLHYVCAGVAETTFRKMGADKKAAWRCLACRALPRERVFSPTFSPTLSTVVGAAATDEGCSASSPPPVQLNSVAEVLQELRDFRSEFTGLKTDLKKDVREVYSLIESLNSKLITMETRFSDIEDRLIAVESKMLTVSKLQTDLKQANDTIASLQNESNMRDQYSRMNNLEISGIPFVKNESLMQALFLICAKVGITIDEKDVDSIQRVRRYVLAGDGGVGAGGAATAASAREPAVIVRFSRRRVKDQLLAAIRARRGITTADLDMSGPAVNIYVSDHLTPPNKLLLKKARELKKELNYTYLWVRDCKIFMRKTDGSKSILISNIKDLHKLK